MGRTTRLHHAVRPQHAVQPRAVETTSPRPAAVARSPLVSLQRSIGNQALGRLVQAKLRIGRPGDRFEREADRVADQVLRMPDGTAPAAITGVAVSGNAARAGRDGAGGGVVGGADRSASQPAPGAALLAALSGGAAGRPLPPAAQAFFEPRLGADLSAVRLHTGPAAGAAAAEIGARAFTHGQSIYFGRGRFAPERAEGRRLLAHELVHTVQQARGSALIQAEADFERDFAGRREIPASETPVPPPRTVRVTNPNGETVWAPYGIYRPSEVPATYQDRVLELPRESVTVRDLTRAETTQGRFRDVRVMMVRVGNDYRFIGYDRSVAWPGRTVTEGFVASERGTGLVGQKLFADRVLRALQSGAPDMHLQVHVGPRTERFHAEIYRIVGKEGQPQWGDRYEISPRQMMRVALAWSEELSTAQRSRLELLAGGASEPTEADAQRVFRGSPAPGRGGGSLPPPPAKGGGPGGGSPSTPPARSASPPTPARSVNPPPSASAGGAAPKASALSASAAKPGPKLQLPRVAPKVTFTPGTAGTRPTPEIARTAVAIAPLPPRAQVRTTVAGAGAQALLASLLSSVRGAEAAKAHQRLAELLRQAETLRWRGNAVVLQIVAEVPNHVDPFAKATGTGNPGQVVYFKSMDIVGVLPRRASVSNQPTMSANLAPRNQRRKDPQDWTLTQQIKGQMGEKYPVEGERPRPGFHYVSRELHLEPFDAPEVRMVKGAQVPATARTYPVPAWIAEKFPSLSTYSYVIAEGKMGFVDPTTNQIRYIVDVDPSQRP